MRKSSETKRVFTQLRDKSVRHVEAGGKPRLVVTKIEVKQMGAVSSPQNGSQNAKNRPIWVFGACGSPTHEVERVPFGISKQKETKNAVNTENALTWWA